MNFVEAITPHVSDNVEVTGPFTSNAEFDYWVLTPI